MGLFGEKVFEERMVQGLGEDNQLKNVTHTLNEEDIPGTIFGDVKLEDEFMTELQEFAHHVLDKTSSECGDTDIDLMSLNAENNDQVLKIDCRLKWFSNEAEHTQFSHANRSIKVKEEETKELATELVKERFRCEKKDGYEFSIKLELGGEEEICEGVSRDHYSAVLLRPGITEPSPIMRCFYDRLLCAIESSLQLKFAREQGCNHILV